MKSFLYCLAPVVLVKGLSPEIHRTLHRNLVDSLEGEHNQVFKLKVPQPGFSSLRELSESLSKLEDIEVDFLGERKLEDLESLNLNYPRAFDEEAPLAKEIDVLVKAEEGINVEDLLSSEGYQFNTATEEFINDMALNLNNADLFCNDGHSACSGRSLQDFYANFQELEAIHARVESLVEANPTRAMLDSIGTSYEGRNLLSVWLGESQDEFTLEHDKPLVFYQCNIHAREWLSPMYCTYMIERLLDGSEESNLLLSRFTFVIVPSLNPDGYVYSYTTFTMWRKTRMPNNGTDCIGTDGNRNWGPEEFHCGEGASTDPCSDTYCGIEPFDQYETAAVENFANTYSARLFSFMDVHSYGGYWMSPWGWTYDLPPADDYYAMKDCFIQARNAVRDVHGQRWTVGTSANAIYIAAGGSDDWWYEAHDVVYAGTVELRGPSFQPDPSNIMPSNEETFAGVVAHLGCAFENEFGQDDLPPLTPTAEPTAFPTWSCFDKEDTGLTIDGINTATCEELAPYCADFEIVHGPCPLTCGTCDKFDGDVPEPISPTESPIIAPTSSPTTTSPTVSPTTSQPTLSPTEVSPTEAPTTNSDSLIETASSELFIAVLIVLLALLLLAICLVLCCKSRKATFEGKLDEEEGSNQKVDVLIS